MNVLVACEFSQVVTEAFTKRGHYAMSCDLLPAEKNYPHYQGDIADVIGNHWDLMIAHPPCTYLSSSGARWWKDRKKEQLRAISFVLWLASASVPRIAIENPIGILSSIWRKPDQIIQPWQFGHGEVKATCLWLKNLPLLLPTNIVDGRYPRVHFESPSVDRGKNRSRTYRGIAEAMATQWSDAADGGHPVICPGR